MLLGYFTEDAYEGLLNDISQNREKYSQSEEWLSGYFRNAGDYYKNSSVEVGNLTLDYTEGKKSDEQKALDDLTNTRLLHGAFRNLTPNQASNKYLWTYLCHMIPEFRKYIQDRWLLEERINTERIKTIRRRFFVTDLRSLVDGNALSRLWWYGHLTYDESSSDHYALTKILLINQTICTDVMGTLNRRNFNRMKGVLLAIRDFQEIAGTRGLSDYVRECNKYLNRYAAVTRMEFLDSEDIRNLAFEKFMELWRRAIKTQ